MLYSNPGKDLDVLLPDKIPSDGVEYCYMVTTRRSSLKPDTIDAFMGISINGPEMSNFNAGRYARAW
uniref:Uncharacterized protein n=1 Tax=Romanomermis culicivorax TaxID=13658 RepID=A0A915JIZ9_ROMCU